MLGGWRGYVVGRGKSVPEHRRIEPDLTLLLGVEGAGVHLIGSGGAAIAIPIAGSRSVLLGLPTPDEMTSLGRNWRGKKCGVHVALTPISSYLTWNGKARYRVRGGLLGFGVGTAPIFTSRRNRPSYRTAKPI